MTNVRHRVRQLESRTKRELEDVLAEELGDSYDRDITNSLRNDLMRACYEAIDSDIQPHEKLKGHPEYSPSWRSWVPSGS